MGYTKIVSSSAEEENEGAQAKWIEAKCLETGLTVCLCSPVTQQKWLSMGLFEPHRLQNSSGLIDYAPFAVCWVNYPHCLRSGFPSNVETLSPHYSMWMCTGQPANLQ